MTNPLLIYDGDCSFCKYWVNYCAAATGDRVAYEPYQEAAERFPDVPREQFRAAVQFAEPSGKICGGAEAIFRALSYAPGKSWLLWMYRRAPGFAPVSEWLYRWVARNRGKLLPLTRFLWGSRLEPAQYVSTRWLFLRLLAVIYLIAFASLWPQLRGLVGAQGILPAGQFLQAVRAELGARGYYLFPTLAWINPSERFLEFLAGAGVLLSLGVLLGFGGGPSLFLQWLFYLSLVTVGRDFMSFQWDILLLEAGFLALFLAPWSFRRKPPPSPAVVWLLGWLVFRLTFLSGSVKLLSDDPTWRNLTALTFHYQTQPIPNMLAWYVHQMPAWFHKLSCVLMFGAELVVPFFIFAPRRLRMGAAFVLIGFQGLIFLTGNYTFFNLLTIALCFNLFDDAFFRHFLPKRLVERIGRPSVPSAGRRLVVAVLAVFVLFLSFAQLAGTFLGTVPEPAAWTLRVVSPYYLVNTYGLFAVMTTSRPEIVIEGSKDGQQWLAYEFKYKPGDLRRAPPQVAPYQPRLDWQMWFAALSNFRQHPWFINLMKRLLEGSPDVLALLQTNPFPNRPPKYVRAVVYDYRFTTFEERRATGNWWKRQPLGLYFPPVSLKF